ncbi:hypothetical protein LX36DRAFT_655393 [Colletotrichum falcatum]|nr:hypothetical protein LX36DRAFT_655393 [Colletotrichum falcatum]
MPQTHHILPWQFFNFEFVRTLAMAPTQGADVGMCLEAASKIKKNDPRKLVPRVVRTSQRALPASNGWATLSSPSCSHRRWIGLCKKANDSTSCLKLARTQLCVVPLAI